MAITPEKIPLRRTPNRLGSTICTQAAQSGETSVHTCQTDNGELCEKIIRQMAPRGLFPS